MDFNRFRLPHQKLDNLTNVQANNLVIKYIRFGARIVGVDVFQPNLKHSWRSLLLIVITHPVILSFLFLLFADESVNDKLEGLCSFVVLSQGLLKFWVSFLNSDYFYSMFGKIDAIHQQYVKDRVLEPLLKQVCFYGVVVAEMLVVCYFTVAFVYYLFPILMWYFFQEQVTIIPIPLPLIDWRTPTGYIINIIHQCLLIFYGGIGITAADTIFLYQIIHSIAYLKIFNHRVQQLNELIECVPQDLRKIEAKLHESIRAHQEYISFVEMVDKNNSFFCFGQLVTSQFTLILSLFMTLWSQWIVGPFLAIAGVCQLLEYCILGTVVTIQNDKASEIIYGMTWYLLPVRLQKYVILMIARGQNPAEIHVGGFAKLNVETAMQIITRTYQCLMMMLEFLG